jgi:cellulose synthase/poly-beta-1,6-N-acetylglucosamine synthase-like glycosyltransferase
VLAAFNLLAFGLIGFGLAYFVLTMGAGLRELRRFERASGGRVPHTYPDPARVQPAASGLHAAAGDLYVWFLVPCLNEEAVIGNTVRCLVANPGARVLVIDDGSEDATAEVAEAAGGESVRVIRRRLPEARQGKGPALNHGYRVLCEEVEAAGIEPALVLVAVMDADGRLSDGALRHVGPLFDDPDVGGVQLAVRIRNRASGLLATFQDFEFWGLSAVMQVGRRATQTVSLGGNAQFTRLSVLQSLPHEPWIPSLTEDLELALTLTLAGWRLTTTPLASVDQQGLERFDLLLRQRARWFQGHMTAARRLGDVWRSSRLAHAAAVELTLYLLVPWVLVLPWSIVWHISLLLSAGTLSFPTIELLGSPVAGRAALLGAFYLFSFAPHLTAGYLYLRQDRAMGRLRAIVLGHLLLPWNYVAFIACWRGFAGLLRGQHGWDKTARVVEPTAVAARAS